SVEIQNGQKNFYFPQGQRGIVFGNQSFQGGRDSQSNKPVQFSNRLIQTVLKSGRMDDALLSQRNLEGKTLLHVASDKGHEKLLAKLLAHPGIDINAMDNYGYTALVLASDRGYQKIVSKLLAYPGIDINYRSQYGYTALGLSCINGRNNTVETLLADPRIEKNGPSQKGSTPLILAAMYGHSKIVKQLVASPGVHINAQNDYGYNALMAASEHGYRKCVETLLQQPGIEINAKDYTGKTALALASMYGHFKCVEKLLAHPDIQVNAKDHKGKTALMDALNLPATRRLNHVWGDFIPRFLKSPRENTINALLAHPTLQMNAKDHKGNTALTWALMNGYEKIVVQLLARPEIEIHAKSQDSKTALAIAAVNGHTKILESLLSHLGPEVDAGSRQKLALILLMANHLTTQDPKNSGSLAFVTLLPELLLSHPIDFLKNSFSSIESFFSRKRSYRNYHPNEAELLLMLKHPDLLDRDPNKTGRLTFCLTSISHFIVTGAQLSDETLKTWGDIGFLTHGFRFWRYDTVGGNDSLMAQFGSIPAPAPRPLNEVFGKGFLYEDKASGALVEFRRGYLLVSHPDKGTLVIRNSSPAFGRDLLKHPAYYLKNSLTKTEILNFDPRTLTNKDSILYRDHYPNNKDSSLYSAKGMTWLTNRLLEINTRYRRFKLDTEAFEKGVFKGHLSPGFQKMVQVLNMFKSKNLPLPDLAFTKPEFPPYQPYYYPDEDMKKMDRFPLTPSHLQELNDFVSGRWSEQKYPESDWLRFLNKAGVENRGELVMLEPEKSMGTTV
ncbi:MAG: ankyrin repeat domain-containing protein, partial [Cyanobacteria bacterium]|nr:ankyrin repeat domain-containing protein [Cyanobacteriota bacterium]